MFGNNPVRKILNSDGSELEVQEIFPTIQGEGVYSGVPAVFLRLGGCNLTCKFCDTEFESFKLRGIKEIESEINKLSLNQNGERSRNLIVITGGEPFRQPIEILCTNLVELGFNVQIETNGTIYRDINDKVDIVCSPKNNGKGYARIREDLLRRINAFKFIISAFDKNYFDVSEVGQLDYKIPVYVQPMDELDGEKNRSNILRAMELAEQNNYRLSLQLHKILNIR